MCKIPERNQAGHYPLEQLPLGWENVRVTYRASLGPRTVIEILSTQEQVFYRHESLCVIAFKCAALFSIANPIYFVFYTALQGVRLFTVPLYNASFAALSKEFWHLIKLPYFFLGMQMSALYGIFCPLEGRSCFAAWESDLHGGKTRAQAAGRHERISEIHPIEQMFFKEDPEWAGFVAICMQPLAHMSNPRITRVETLQSSQFA